MWSTGMVYTVRTPRHKVTHFKNILSTDSICIVWDLGERNSKQSQVQKTKISLLIVRILKGREDKEKEFTIS